MVAELSLLTVPPFSFLCFKAWHTNNRVLLGLISAVIILSVLYYFDITFRGDAADYIFPVLLYFSYGFLIYHTLLIKNSFLRIISFLICFIPFLLGYLIATIGVLGLMLGSGEYDTSQKSKLAYGLESRIYGYGNATSSESGEKFEVYRYIPWLPVFEKKVFSKKINWLNINQQKIITSYDAGKSKIKIVVDGQTKLDSIVKL
ncbi:MAG: hypothetical protein INR69_17765 [Mucilaginibacter polytrichastri]|nr:hypothetical protein [Mucilaginibacter polytrichastri]